MADKIKTAIFGAGFGDYGHYQALKQLPAYEIVALCGSGFRRHSSEKVYDSKNWMNLIDENEIDLAVMAVPPEAQTEILVKCLEKNIAVLPEKPLCLDETQLHRIRRAYQQNPVRSAGSFIFPELETWKKAKAILSTGQIGTLRSLYFDWRIESAALKNKTKNWKSTAGHGGGALFHFLPHLLHAIHFFGGTIESLSCVSLPACDLGSEWGQPLCSIQFILRNKALVVINCSLAAPQGSGQSIEFNGSKSSMVLENRAADYVREFKLKLKGEAPQEWIEQELNPFLSDRLDSRTAPLMSIYNRFASKKEISPNLDEVIQTQKLILLCEKSDQQRRWLSVEASPN